MSNIYWYLEKMEASVLTDVLNWKTIEKSYRDLSKRFGNDYRVISSHQRLWDKLTRETNKLAAAQTNINEIMFNESMHLRYRILLDVISNVPLDESYVKLRETMGDIKYQDFEFWYYRFYNGQRDLDYDRSKDPKPLTFSDLPIDVIEKIVGKLDVESRYKLRSVSRGLKNLVDSSLLVMERITERPLQYLSAILRNPKLQLGVLDLNFPNFWGEIKLVDNVFRSLPHQLHVRCLELAISHKQDLMDFIRCLKPRILKRIKIGWDKIKSVDIHGIIESEQWKHAEEVFIANPIICNFAHFFHFKSFNICLKEFSTESIL